MGANLLHRLAHLRLHAREGLGAGRDLEQRLGRLVHVQHAPLDREDEHGVRQAVDGRLRRLLGLEQLAERAAAILAKLVRHHVQLATDLRDLVLAAQPCARIEVPFADAADGEREQLEGAQGTPGEPYRSEQRQPESADGGEHQQ